MNGLEHLSGLKRRRAGSGDGDLRLFRQRDCALQIRYNMIHMAMTINLATNYNTKSSEAQDANKLLTSCQDRE